MTRRQTRGLFPAATLAFFCLASACGDDDGEPEQDDAGGLDAGGRDAGRQDGGSPEPGKIDAGRDASIDAALRDASSDAGGDAAEDASTSLAARLAQLEQSRTAWNSLAAAHPGPYWFEEENCLINAAIGGQSRVVKVEAGTAQQFATYMFARSECQALVNRLGTQIAAGSGTPETFPGLYTTCATLLNTRSDTHLSFDNQNVIKACWVGDAPGCRDNCGSGFYLREWGFGVPAPKLDGGVHPDAGVYTDAGARPDAG